MSLWEPLLTMPVLPATLLLAVVLAWSLIAVLGGALSHGHDAHWDWHAEGDASDLLSSIGSATLKWVHFGEMPLMIWLGLFSLLWWSVSILLLFVIDLPLFGAPGWLIGSLLMIRNLLATGYLTRLATRPLRGWYGSEGMTSQSLVGQECEICSYEATTEYGQVRFKTDGAPLLLNVRTDGPDLPKGTRVWITHYDTTRRAYIVSPTSQGN
jgi:hypothetical protein